MSYKEIYDLHVQFLHTYEKHEKHQGPYQREINHFIRQFFLTEDVLQKNFVLNQLVKIHEKGRAEIVKWFRELLQMRINIREVQVGFLELRNNSFLTCAFVGMHCQDTNGKSQPVDSD